MSRLTTQDTRWFPTFPERRPGCIRLFCIPHAGAGASIYRTWAEALPPFVLVSPIQPPGREERLGETPQTSIASIAEELAPALAARLDGPYVLFGYSMGALVAYETACRLRRIGVPMPNGIVVAAHRAPQAPSVRKVIWDLPDDQFLAELRGIGGMSDEVLACAELVDLLLPLLRADFQACDIYSAGSEPPLDVPITVFGGWKDPHVAPETLEAWRECSLQPLTLRMFPGGHFFLKENRELMLRSLAQCLMQLREPRQ